MKALLLDEMLTPRIAERLRADGVEVTAISGSVEYRGISDLDVLELATRQQRVLVTSNIKDFARLSRAWAGEGRTHAGILVISAKRYPPDRSFVGRIASALAERSTADRWPQPGQLDFL